MKWAMELSQFDIAYVPRASIKGQALADFIVECSGIPPEESVPRGPRGARLENLR